MIRLTERTREKLMLVHGCSMVLLGLALFYIRSTMTNLFFYVFGSAFALLLVAASLLFITGVDWICAMGLGRHQQIARFPVPEYSCRHMQSFADLLSGRNSADAVLSTRFLCLVPQCGKIQLCPVVEWQQARAIRHVCAGLCGAGFQCLPGRIFQCR